MSNIQTTQPQNTQQQALSIMETSDFKKQLQAILPAHVNLDQFLSVARRGILGNKALNFSSMDRGTLYSSVLKAAEQGMKLDGEEAALVQYGPNVQFMKMIKGVKKQLRNSGEIKEITAEVVYKNDKFDYWVDDQGKHIKHSPNFLEDRGELVAAYSIITTKDGGVYIKVMSKQEIEAVQKSSKTGNASFSPWNGAFKSEMWCKTVLRRNAKDAPTSTDLPEVFKDWDESFDFSQQAQQGQQKIESVENSEPKEQPKQAAPKKSRLDKIVENETKKVAEEPLSNMDSEPPQLQDSEIPI